MGSLRLVAVLGLTLSTAVWGSTFFLSKQVVDEHDPLTVLALRFTAGAVIMLALRPRCLVGLPRAFWVHAVALGAVYGGAQLPHYYGLREVPASTAGFLIGVYVVLVPVLDLVLFRRRSTRRTVFGVLLAAAGLAVFALSEGGSTLGFTLCLLAAVVYALQISAMGAWSPAGGTWAFTLLQLATVGVVLGSAATVKGLDVPTERSDWLIIAYLAVVASVLAVGIQVWAQHRIPTEQAAVIMAGEPLWAAVLAVTLTAESLTARLVVGGLVLLVANAVIATGAGPPPPPTPSTPAPAHQDGGELGEPDDDDRRAERRGGATVATAGVVPGPSASVRRGRTHHPQDEHRGDRKPEQ